MNSRHNGLSKEKLQFDSLLSPKSRTIGRLFVETVLAVTGCRLRSEGFFPRFRDLFTRHKPAFVKVPTDGRLSFRTSHFLYANFDVKLLSRSQLNYHNSVEEKVISQRVGKKNSLKKTFCF